MLMEATMLVEQPFLPLLPTLVEAQHEPAPDATMLVERFGEGWVCVSFGGVGQPLGRNGCDI